ncbi:hypothetical protein WJX81_006826 [Elliptochloris bilobata]|uniref:Uncharacterized protein n=1 Tax=Elliptochloris bilobata TaxID=381761 RepID=A0AAW1RNF2_9CHLO
MQEDERAVRAARSRLSPAAKDLLAGAGAGAVGVLAGQPLDVVRVRLQQPHSRMPGALASLQSLVRAEGPGALFKGSFYPLTTIALQNAVAFHAYGVACRHFAGGPDPTTPLTYPEVYAAGAFAGLVQCAVSTPVDLLKIRQQLQRVAAGAPGYVGPLRLLRDTWRCEGLAGLYRGLGVTTIRDTPSYGIYFCLYEHSKDVLEPGSRQHGCHNPLTLFVAGGVAGVLSWASVYPFDVVKSRMQASRYGAVYKGWLHCAAKTVREEGRGALFRGMAPTLGRAAVVNAALFPTYEALMWVMRGHDPADVH